MKSNPNICLAAIVDMMVYLHNYLLIVEYIISTFVKKIDINIDISIR